MEISFGLILFIIFILILLFRVIPNRRPKLTAPCPMCESTNVIETNRETLATRTVESGGTGTGAGNTIRLQLDLELTFRCRECNHKYSRTFTETQ